MKLLLLITLFVFFVPAVQASEEHPYHRAKEHYQKIIDACQVKSQPKWDTGVTTTMQEGTYDYLHCLTDEIKRISESYFVNPNEAGNREELLKSLRSFTRVAFVLYQHIHYGPCSPCGTQHISMRVMDVAVHVENVLKDMLYQAYDYERPVSDAGKP